MNQGHERVVSVDDSSFPCQICWRRFARENDLKTHLWCHTQEKYNCELCHRAFTCASDRQQHFKRAHKDVNISSPPSIVSSPQPVQSPSPQQSQALQQVANSQQLSIITSPQLTISTSQQLTIATTPPQLTISTISDTSNKRNSPPCEICGKRFAFKYYVKIHQTVHTREKPYICDLCHKTFSQASSRNRHRKEMHKEGTDLQQNGLQLAITDGSEKIVSQFDVLGKQFPSSRALYEVHPVPEAKEKNFSCNLCHKRFTQASSRNRHLKEMHKDGDTPLPPGEHPNGTRRAVGVLTRNVGPACDVCGKRFPCKSLLEIHMRVHTKERPFSCEICFKTFSQVSSRNFHRRKMHKDLILSIEPAPTPQQQQQQHQQQLALKQTTLVESGGKLVPECGVCGKRFPCKSLMEIHMRVHTRERPYSCEICFKTFTQVSSRNFHKRKIHKEQISSPNSQTSPSSQGSLSQQLMSLSAPSQTLLALPSPPSNQRPQQPLQKSTCQQQAQLSRQASQMQQLQQVSQMQHLRREVSEIQLQQEQLQEEQQQEQLEDEMRQEGKSQQQMRQEVNAQPQQMKQEFNLQQLRQEGNSQPQQMRQDVNAQQQQMIQDVTSQQQQIRQEVNSQQQQMRQELNSQQDAAQQQLQQEISQLQNSPLSPHPQSPLHQQSVQQAQSPTQQPNLMNSQVLHHQVQQASPTQQGQTMVSDSNDKNFHCKMDN